jgi:GAF domain-containing protein
MAALAVVSFFVVFLILVLRQKEKYFQYCPHIWRMLTLGGVSFLLAGSAHLASALYQGGEAWTSGWGQVIQVVEIAGYLAGGGLILGGFLGWCGSLLEGKNNATERLRQLACLKSILSVTNHRSELDGMFKETLPVVMKLRGYEMGVVFKRAFNSSEMTLAAHKGVQPENLFTLFELCSKNQWYQETLKSQEIITSTDVKNLPEYGTLVQDQHKVTSFACVPVKFRGKVYGLLGVYDSKPDRFSYQEIQFLSSVGETLGLAARQLYTCKRNKIRRDYISAVENVLNLNQEAVTLQDAFPRISTELGRIIDFDQVSLDLMTGAGREVQRISIGTSGGMLVDKKAVISSVGNSPGRDTNSPEVRIESDLGLTDKPLQDPLVKACGIRSRIVLPLGEGKSFCGFLCLGHKKPNFYSASDARWLRLFVLGLCHLVRVAKLREKSERKESLKRSLYESEKKLAGEVNLKTFLQDAATRLTSDLPKSFARVMLLDREKDQLINCAASQIRREGINLKQEERFCLNDLPWHRLVLEAKRPMLVNQDDPESVMTRSEARLVMDEELNSALLVPLTVNDQPVGILSVGEMRNWGRQPLTSEEMDFVQHKANQLSLALKKGVLGRSNARLKESLRDSRKPQAPKEGVAWRESDLSDLSYRISNPLTIIRGAAELLKLTETDLGPDSLRYIRNIENSVDRIQNSLRDFLSVAAEGRKSTSDRPGEKAVAVCTD